MRIKAVYAFNLEYAWLRDQILPFIHTIAIGCQLPPPMSLGVMPTENKVLASRLNNTPVTIFLLIFFFSVDQLIGQLCLSEYVREMGTNT